MRIVSIFNRDLRLTDNKLLEGWQSHEIIPLFLMDDLFLQGHGEKFKSLFFYYVQQFSEVLKNLGSEPYFIRFRDFGKFLDITKPDLLRYPFSYEPPFLRERASIEKECEKRDIKVESTFHYLIPPYETNFKRRFTVFYKNIFKPYLIKNPPTINNHKPKYLLKPKVVCSNELIGFRWNLEVIKLWYKSEEEVQRHLNEFLLNKLSEYHNSRDYPALDATSKLSVYIRLGVISFSYIYSKALEYKENEKFIQELAWSEFFRIWLYHNPEAICSEYKEKWRGFPWLKDDRFFEKWKAGETGYKLIDAGMRQLNREGWIHNRLRMVTASFLTKNLLLDWRLGERYFFEHLVDADTALNVGNWQWIAGCGLDSVPYFRVFNPILQLQKYDPNSSYVSKYISEDFYPVVDFQKTKIGFIKLANRFLKTPSGYR